ncbi:hypothetical protein [Ammoniphilus resinae]|uniref:Uncharacterized protein n=1 Tax=Ammoniphilus resinae TaxID=861532 RepID=A0ABS4GRS0_9BACL|nr:hypothetical protein [Ammoniphilus resinae]MBP1932954.1 hypothetical protein [Ammoniphilus resinae]
MIHFFELLIASFAILYVIVHSLSEAMKRDSAIIDKRDLWGNYDVTLEDMKLNK